MAWFKSDNPEKVRRTPPGQRLTEKFPVLTNGGIPHIDPATWRFRLFGLVESEKALTWDEFMALPQTTVTADFHCVTTWSRLANVWEGVLFKDLIKTASLRPEARYVMAHCYGGYTTNLPLAALNDEDVLFAHKHDGRPLSADHGGPLRLVVPRRYAWKSAKWVNGLEFMDQDRPGFWEQNGYSMSADPWKEERYSDG